jgi:perosamine synthetase
MHEVPPTAGLPLVLKDLLPISSEASDTFERSLAQFLRVPGVQVECSGTASEIVVLSALRRDSSRRQVIVPAYTCPLVVLAILHCGLTPVLCDLRVEHFDLNLVELSKRCNGDTLAIVATHLGGRVAALTPVLDIARRTGAYVLEDAAQALGATSNGLSVGMLGDAGFFSLAAGKGLSIFEGGVLLAREESMRRQLHDTEAEIIAPNAILEARRTLQLMGYAGAYRPSLLGLAYGIPLRRAVRRGKLIEAVGDNFAFDIPLHRVGRWRKMVGMHALQRLPAFLEALRLQAERRIERLAAIRGLKVMRDARSGRGVWPFLMILMPSEAARNTALRALWAARLGVNRLYIHALPDYPYFAGTFADAQVPNARDFAARLLTISNSPWLDEDGFAQIYRTLEKAVQ